LTIDRSIERDRKTTMSKIQGTTLTAVLLILSIYGTACAPNVAPTGPDTLTGIIGPAGYALHRWDGGLMILVLHDAPEGLFCEGTGSTSSPEYLLECEAESPSGAELAWEIRSSDGKQAQMMIDGEVFNLSDDSIFFIRTIEGSERIETKIQNLSNLTFNNQAVLQLAEIDPTIQAFVTSIK
jgi:hypothetical protein